tara:strand:+ start:475 stop:669 length:195 start_codon:yes stop_codon:yes gene_type:complete
MNVKQLKEIIENINDETEVKMTVVNENSSTNMHMGVSHILHWNDMCDLIGNLKSPDVQRGETDV